MARERISSPPDDKEAQHGVHRLRSRLRLLYHGQSPAALRFQAIILIVDLAIIAFFIATPLLRESETFLWIDYSIAACSPSISSPGDWHPASRCAGCGNCRSSSTSSSW
jgi:hypothetical protein